MTSLHNLCTWSLFVTLALDLCAAQFYFQSWVDWAPFHGFAKCATSFKYQKSVVSARNVLRKFFCLRWASFLINLVYLLDWPFYNFKSFKFNGSASLFGRKNRKLLVLSLELSPPPVQWPDLVLAGVFIRTVFPPAKISLLELLPLRIVALLHQTLLCQVLLLYIQLLKWPKLVLAGALV